MRRALAIAASVLLLLGGCDAEVEKPRSRVRPPGGLRSGVPAVNVLPRLELRADLSERPARWRLIARIPFGPRTGELGFFYDRRRGSLPLLPRSFAVADDGSFWILDGIKRRVAHFSRTGRFIEDVGGFRADRLSPRPKDVAVVGDQVYVVEEEFGRATLTTIGPDRRRVPEPVTDGFRPVAVSVLLPAVDRLVARIGGYADPPGSGPSGYAELPLEDSLRLLPGVPVDEQTWVDVDALSDQELEFTSTRGSSQSSQPIHVDVFGGSRSRRIPGLVGPAIEAIFDEGVGIYVRVTPARPADAERFGGGAWFLRLGADRSRLLWERLPDAGVSAEEQVRHLSAGPDGRIYLMVADADGERIYMRRGGAGRP